MLNGAEQPKLKRAYGVLLGLICLGIVINCFFNLSGGAVQDWDESHYGLTAYEALRNDNLLVGTYKNATDYWNTKPPLCFLPITLGYKLFGVNVFGLRFFSALSACVMLLCMVGFCCKQFPVRAAVFIGLIQLSLYRFFTYHNARTADADALFLLFNTAGLLLALYWPRRLNAYLAASFLAGLAFLTKSFHAIPMVLLLIAFFGMEFPLSRKSFGRAALCLCVALLPVALWGIARFQFDGTQYFERMVFYDLIARSTEVLDGHDGDSFYYLNFIGGRYALWFGVAVAAAACSARILRVKSGGYGLPAVQAQLSKKTLCKIVLAALLPLLLYSASTSKLRWYVYPSFPFISICLGLFLNYCLMLIETQSRRFAKVFIICVLGLGLSGGAFSLLRIYQSSTEQNPVHIAMQELAGIPDNHNARLFLDTGGWHHADWLAAKFYGNFQLMPGNIAAYEANANQGKAFLLINPFEKERADYRREP